MIIAVKSLGKGAALRAARVNLVLSGGERVVRAALQIHPDAPTVKKVGQVPGRRPMESIMS